VGRHSKEEIYQLGKDDITAIATSLGQQKFFFGEQPSSIDAVLYGFLANIITPPINSPLKQHTMSYSNLVEHCERMKQKYYP
jgi:glutathione S-transferase